ncbi:MAG TPA: hypothetical protein VGQ59_00625 [Cyclobacteriaceae bacterium]|jgi:hypothetical protein|nr:hypothetical protein [Cyclobacteriaceae bacterium]
MKNFKKIFRYLFLGLLILLALSGVFFTIAPRRPNQDYDNEVKTELVEGKEDNSEMSNRN